MYGGACLSEPSLLQRAVGELRVAVKRSRAETVLDELRQAGCLKARFPRRLVPGWMDIVMLNTGGGVAGSDRLDLSIGVGAGAQATIAAQAAERFYRARAGDAPSKVRTHLTVEAGAALEWLPQETILFDQSAVDRRLEVDLAADARFLGVETIVFGRTAMGELVRQGWLRDLIRVYRDSDLLLHDAIRIDGDIDATLQRAAVATGAKVVATIVYVAPDTAEKLVVLRSTVLSTPQPSRPPSPLRLPAHEPTEAAATVRNGMLIARILGPNSASVRRTVIAALTVLRENRPLPRVWLC
jgi:urease accessory protein